MSRRERQLWDCGTVMLPGVRFARRHCKRPCERDMLREVATAAAWTPEVGMQSSRSIRLPKHPYQNHVVVHIAKSRKHRQSLKRHLLSHPLPQDAAKAKPGEQVQANDPTY